MNPGQTLVIRDYLLRYKWCYLAGVILHFVIAIALTHGAEVPLIGMIASSGFLLGMDLMRGGNSSARTLLALPLTAPQLARAWRYVAFTMPVVLYFIVLTLGVLTGLATGGRDLSLAEFGMFAFLQTGMLGLFFFALTGLQTQPSPGAPLLEKATNLFFGLLWGFSIPAVTFTQNLSGTSILDTSPAHLAVWTFLAIVTIAGYFRAETLVHNRASSKKLAPSARRPSPSGNNMPWQGFGALPYYALIFGSLTGLFFVVMLTFTWFIMNEFLGLNGTEQDGNTGGIQLNMFFTMIGMVSIFQIFPMLRSLRTLPRRLTSLTTFIMLWPLFLILALGLVTFSAHAALTNSPFNLPSFLSSAAGACTILIAIPFFLRFGLNFLTVFGMILIASFSGNAGLLLSSVWKIDLTSHLTLLTSALTLILAIVWITTYRTLGSEHPWRANRFAMGLMKRPS
ncbi:MAG: hypothetical protein ACSHYF_04545 [Verrucomicrobiaceae bacterium]